MNLSDRNSSSEWITVMLQLVCLLYDPGVVVIQRVQRGQGPLADDRIQQYTTKNLTQSTHTDMRKHDIIHTCRLCSLKDKHIMQKAHVAQHACAVFGAKETFTCVRTCKSRVDKARLDLHANTCTKISSTAN